MRGALVHPRPADEDEQGGKKNIDRNDNDDGNYWKQSARVGDYSRMLYAPGDGVILRRSSTTLPGQWHRLLVRGQYHGDVRASHLQEEENLTNNEGVVETSHRHVTLLSDVDGIGRAVEACRLARKKREKT